MTRLLRAVGNYLAARDAWKGPADPAKNYARVRDDEARAEAELRAAFREAMEFIDPERGCT